MRLKLRGLPIYLTSSLFNDWSKAFALRFSKVLKQCGFTEKNCPTLHSFRHRFIDELQQAGIEEHVTSELVGHSKRSLTYGRYGKRLNLSVLIQSVEKSSTQS